MHTLAIILVGAALIVTLALYARTHRELPDPKLEALRRMPEKEVGKAMNCIAHQDYEGADNLIKPYMK